MIESFIDRHEIDPKLIAWHGHTIFHDPIEHATSQIGDGAAIVGKTGRHVVSQFRNLDMALGGQGAPLAPLADKLLLEQADFYLNLGGISNISFRSAAGEFHAFDISPCNQVFNALAKATGLEYDDGGRIASAGTCIESLLTALNNLPYYLAEYPKSIDNNWIRTTVLPLIDAVDDSIENKMNTCVLHVAQQISTVIKNHCDGPAASRVLITGGGAYNKFLITKIKANLADHSVQIILPDARVIEFKEAALMALMGYLYYSGMENVLHEVTGANRPHIGGCLFQGWKNKLHIDG